MSRGVRCGIVSTPVNRSMATDAMIPLIRARLRRELAEVLGRRMRKHDALTGHAREADVREHREHALAHLAERAQRRGWTGAVVRAERGDTERAQPLARRACGDARDRLGLRV